MANVNQLVVDGLLSENNKSLQILKRADLGDLVLLVSEDTERLFEVVATTTKVGRKGDTSVVLRTRKGEELPLDSTNVLPKGVTRVLRVSTGINAATMKRLEREQPVDLAPCAD
jgi:hypothetical protein